MLSKFIVSSYGVFIEISLWLSLLASVVSGYMVNGILAAIGFFVIWFVCATVFFGGFLILEDIRIAVNRSGEIQYYSVIDDIRKSMKKIASERTAIPANNPNTSPKDIKPETNQNAKAIPKKSILDL